MNNEMYPFVLNDLYKKNNDVHAHNTRFKDMFHISFRTQTFSNDNDNDNDNDNEISLFRHK